MKRSEVNANLRWAVELLDRYQFKLPRFAYWSCRAGILRTSAVENLMRSAQCSIPFGTASWDSPT